MKQFLVRALLLCIIRRCFILPPNELKLLAPTNLINLAFAKPIYRQIGGKNPHSNCVLEESVNFPQKCVKLVTFGMPLSASGTAQITLVEEEMFQFKSFKGCCISFCR